MNLRGGRRETQVRMEVICKKTVTYLRVVTMCLPQYTITVVTITRVVTICLPQDTITIVEIMTIIILVFQIPADMRGGAKEATKMTMPEQLEKEKNPLQEVITVAEGTTEETFSYLQVFGM